MNREIKFRAWDGEQMIYLDKAGLQYFDFEGSYALSFVVDGYKEFWAHECYERKTEEANKFPLMQYVNSKDSKGNNVYEGDILKAPSGNMFVVEWYSDEMRWGMKWKDCWYNMNFKILEVVGSIYENPDLLQ